MHLDKITLGKNFPDDINVVIEIPMHADPVKYEIDKESGLLKVDRLIQVSMSYPCNYGFIPHTCAGDGDPVDVLVITAYPLIPGSVISTRAVGVLLMEDEAGPDEKIITLPSKHVDAGLAYIEDIDGINLALKDRIVHFFSHYKDLEPNKFVRIHGFAGKDRAISLLRQSVNQ